MIEDHVGHVKVVPRSFWHQLAREAKAEWSITAIVRSSELGTLDILQPYRPLRRCFPYGARPIEL